MISDNSTEISQLSKQEQQPSKDEHEVHTCTSDCTKCPISRYLSGLRSGLQGRQLVVLEEEFEKKSVLNCEESGVEIKRDNNTYQLSTARKINNLNRRWDNLDICNKVNGEKSRIEETFLGITLALRQELEVGKRTAS